MAPPLVPPADPRLAFALPLVEAAGQQALGYFRNLDALKIGSKGLQDPVSEADRAVERFLGERIAAAYPADGLLGEEHGARPGQSGFTWVIDPIDGTANFIAGIPCWCVVVALLRGTETIAGIVHDPNAGETFWAARGGGVFLGDRPISVSRATRLDAGSVGLGHSTRVPPGGAVRAMELILDAGGMFFRNATGAIMLAYVAAGRLLGYAEAHMNPWDCLAGMLLVEEAGGQVWPVPGAEMLRAGGRVVAAGPGVYAEICGIAEAAYRQG